jgi:hypothetical protein
MMVAVVVGCAGGAGVSVVEQEEGSGSGSSCPIGAGDPLGVWLFGSGSGSGSGNGGGGSGGGGVPGPCSCYIQTCEAEICGTEMERGNTFSRCAVVDDALTPAECAAFAEDLRRLGVFTESCQSGPCDCDHLRDLKIQVCGSVTDAECCVSEADMRYHDCGSGS